MNRFDGIDPLEPLAALDVRGVTRVQPISGGMDTLIWRVDTARGAYALRLFGLDQRDQCAHEVRAMRLAGTLGVPVPTVTTHGMWGDRPAMLMEWCEGRTVLEETRAHPDAIESIGVSMGQLHARIHAVPVQAEYWDDHRDWLEMAGPNEAELRTRLREVGLRDGHLLHLDFHPRNVMCTGGAAKVVLDWANMRVGDPRADVARTRSIFRLGSPPPAAASPASNSASTRLERAWMDGYTQVAGQLPDMVLFEIWADVAFIRDMEQHIGKPGFWMEPPDFERVRAGVAALKHRVVRVERGPRRWFTPTCSSGSGG